MLQNTDIKAAGSASCEFDCDKSFQVKTELAPSNMKDLSLDSLAEIIEIYLSENEKVTKSEFAKRVGVGRSQFHAILRRDKKANPGLETVLKIIQETGFSAYLSKDW